MLKRYADFEKVWNTETGRWEKEDGNAVRPAVPPLRSGAVGSEFSNDALSLNNVETFKMLLEEPEQPVEWLVEGFIPAKNRGFMPGEPSAGKTWIALLLGIAVTTGRPLFEKFSVSEPGPVIFFDLESNRRNLQRRIHAIAKAENIHPADLEHFHFMSEKFLKLPENETELLKLVLTLNVKLIVFDCFRRLHNKNENESHQIQPVLESLQRVQRDGGCALLIIHHLRKSNGNDNASVFERMRGSSDLWAWRDFLVGVEPERGTPNHYKVSFQFRDAESPPPLMVIREIMPDGGVLHRSEVIDQGKAFRELAQRIKDAFVDGPQSKTGALEKVQGKDAKKYEAFEFLVGKRELIQEGKKWRLP